MVFRGFFVAHQKEDYQIQAPSLCDDLTIPVVSAASLLRGINVHNVRIVPRISAGLYDQNMGAVIEFK